MSKKSKRQKNKQALGNLSEIGLAAIAAEEKEIVQILDSLADRISKLPGKRNTDTPLHRVKTICYSMWTETKPEVYTRIRGILIKDV